MKFTLQDIKNLYGDYLYVLKEDSPKQEVSSVVAEAEPTLFQEGVDIDWKMKPDSKLALVLNQEEFENAESTSLLKQWVLQAELDTKGIGFGIIPKGAESIHFTDMPVEIAVVFGPPEAPGVDSITVAKKDIFILPQIHLLQADTSGPQRAISTLQQAKFLIPRA